MNTSSDCLYRRDTIVTRGDAQSKMKKKVLTKGNFERQMAELRKKIKTTIQVGFFFILLELLYRSVLTLLFSDI